MTTQIVSSTPENKKPVVVHQQHGAFEIEPHSQNSLNVRSKTGVVVGGLLYSFVGSMFKHPSGWVFAANNIDIPKLAPKQRELVIQQVTAEVNLYLEQHPEILQALEFRNWTKKLESLEYELRQARAMLVHLQADLEQRRRTLQERIEAIPKLEEKLAEHQANRPEGMPEEDGEAPS